MSIIPRTVQPKLKLCNTKSKIMSLRLLRIIRDSQASRKINLYYSTSFTEHFDINFHERDKKRTG